VLKLQVLIPWAKLTHQPLGSAGRGYLRRTDSTMITTRHCWRSSGLRSVWDGDLASLKSGNG